MICGFLGVGKTTFAAKLAERERAVRFSLDELYFRLFADGPTHELDFDAMDRLSRVVETLWTGVVRAGASVVLDLGFWDRRFRDETRALVESLDATPRLYWLTCSDEIAFDRCQRRNGAPGAFLVSPEGYGEMRCRFEPPADEERPTMIDTNPA
jgi:hypothetical protein